MRMRSAKLNALKLRLRAVFYDCGNIPILGDVVGHGAKFHFRRPKDESRLPGRLSGKGGASEKACGAQRQTGGLEKIPAMRFHEWIERQMALRVNRGKGD